MVLLDLENYLIVYKVKGRFLMYFIEWGRVNFI